MKKELGMARCGLACCLCSENQHCGGCHADDCAGAAGCEVRKCCIGKGINYCFECGEAEQCRKGILSKLKPHAFTFFVKKYGMDKLMECLGNNEKRGIVYHRNGITGDYDECSDMDGLMKLIEKGEKQMEQNRTAFGHMPDGAPVDLLTLRDGACACEIITYGGAVRSLSVPARDGAPVDVALGFDTLEDYRTQDKYIGALVGRYANRIGGAKFLLNGKEYPLSANDGVNSLHGGPTGFHAQVWTVEALSENSVALTLSSPDGHEGYPGALDVRVAYTLRGGALTLNYWAKSDRDTVCSLTNHSYFNLSGHNSGSVESQYIRLYASRYTPTDSRSIPTGEIAPVDGTVMDLRRAQPMGACIDEPFEQLVFAGGWDHNWIIDRWDGTPRPAAWVWSPDTGIAMETLTTLPGVQFYSGNYLDGCPAGKGGAPYAGRWGFCLETQHFPDSPNKSGFPSCVLHAGEEYRSTTVYRFSAPDPKELDLSN